jgi:hypothetical protein
MRVDHDFQSSVGDKPINTKILQRRQHLASDSGNGSYSYFLGDEIVLAETCRPYEVNQLKLFYNFVKVARTNTANYFIPF